MLQGHPPEADRRQGPHSPPNERPLRHATENEGLELPLRQGREDGGLAFGFLRAAFRGPSKHNYPQG